MCFGYFLVFFIWRIKGGGQQEAGVVVASAASSSLPNVSDFFDVSDVFNVSLCSNRRRHLISHDPHTLVVVT